VVVVPDLARGGPAPDWKPEVKVRRSSGGDEIAVRMRRVMNTTMARVVLEETRHREAEERRLLYVALTRARKRLIVINHQTRDVGKWVQALDAWGYRIEGGEFPEEGELSPGVLHRRVTPGPALTRSPGRPLPDLLEAVRSFEAARGLAETEPPPRFRSPSDEGRTGLDQAAPEEEANGPPRPSPELARAAGVAVHRALESWDFADPAVLERAAAGAAPAIAGGFGVDPDLVRREAVRILQGFAGSAAALRLREAEILARELPILFRDAEGTIVHGYADLVYRHGGRLFVADYKTDSDPGEAKARAYRGQLADYATALREALDLPEDPVAEILFVRTGERVTVGD
jgi:ATP-dependent exoDNAse (exonuclease V) beta subunit